VLVGAVVEFLEPQIRAARVELVGEATEAPVFLALLLDQMETKTQAGVAAAEVLMVPQVEQEATAAPVL
jgi:hypothetical protein